MPLVEGDPVVDDRVVTVQGMRTSQPVVQNEVGGFQSRTLYEQRAAGSERERVLQGRTWRSGRDSLGLI